MTLNQGGMNFGTIGPSIFFTLFLIAVIMLEIKPHSKREIKDYIKYNLTKGEIA